MPPRYRRRRSTLAAAEEQAERVTAGAQQRPEDAQMGDGEPRTAPVAVGVSGVNGATAIGARSHFPERRKCRFRALTIRMIDGITRQSAELSCSVARINPARVTVGTLPGKDLIK